MRSLIMRTFVGVTSIAMVACSSPIPSDLQVGASNLVRLKSCKDLLQAGATVNGIYTVDFDGAGDAPAVDVYCDQESGEGGWMLVLNYLHQGGTNPALVVFDQRAPLQGPKTLGVDESSSSTNWGHMGPSLLGKADFEELRFQCSTSNHSRRMDFIATDQGCIDYFSTGVGACYSDNFSSQIVTQLGHNANLPFVASTGYSSMGQYALTHFPFYSGGGKHWGIRGVGGGLDAAAEGSRWECDDFYTDFVPADTPADQVKPYSYRANTHHQVWVR